MAGVPGGVSAEGQVLVGRETTMKICKEEKSEEKAIPKLISGHLYEYFGDGPTKGDIYLYTRASRTFLAHDAFWR